MCDALRENVTLFSPVEGHERELFGNDVSAVVPAGLGLISWGSHLPPMAGRLATDYVWLLLHLAVKRWEKPVPASVIRGLTADKCVWCFGFKDTDDQVVRGIPVGLLSPSVIRMEIRNDLLQFADVQVRLQWLLPVAIPIALPRFTVGAAIREGYAYQDCYESEVRREVTGLSYVFCARRYVARHAPRRR